MGAANTFLLVEYAPPPDLIVESITPNCGYIFGNESNELCAKITNNGTGAAGAFNVSFVAGAFNEQVRVPGGLAAGANTTVCVTDTTMRAAGESVTVNVTADCNGEVTDLNETNNASSVVDTVVNNGYKGKTYTGGENITTWQFYDQAHVNLIYSTGDSRYQGGYNTLWTTYTANWTASDIPIPSGATIKAAVLYTYYTFDRTPAGNITDYLNLSFNGNVVPVALHYTDRKGYGGPLGYDFPYGMIKYNVLGSFNVGDSNQVVLENTEPTLSHHVSLSGMMLMVVYEHADEPSRMIWINEGFDIISARTSYCVTSEEATAYAPFAGGTIEPDSVDKATLVTVMQDAFDGGDKNRLYFNGGEWHGIWDTAAKQGDTSIAVNETGVLAYLAATDNTACLQSHIPDGETQGDGMGAANTFLLVEYAPPAPTPTPKRGGGGGSGAKDLAIPTPTPTSLAPTVTKATRTVPLIEAGKEVAMLFADMDVRLIALTADTNVSDVKVVIERVEKSTEIPDPSSIAYAYLEITVEHEGDANIDAKIECKVLKSWIADNNIDESTITLSRYDKDEGWTVLATSKTGEDDEFVYFVAETSGFSIFAIAGEQAAAATPAPTPVGTTTATPETVSTPSPTTTPTPASEVPSFETILAIACLLAIAYLRLRMERE